MNIYYLIWVDFIVKVKSIPANKNNWKQYSMIFMSMAMALNLCVLISIIQLHILKHIYYDVSLTIFRGEKLNNFISFFILYLLAPLVLNYILIFRDDRYKALIAKKKNYNGKLIYTYFFGTLVFSLIYFLFFTPTI